MSDAKRPRREILTLGFKVHDDAAKKRLAEGATPRQATISGLAAELMFLRENDR